ncbi:MucBP domain-containing protein [Hominifimenecus sp. rT4P-3]|uniref:MucBP domain-containing protein n=1 Tax=Hominifimenecus sp. rT4P-3 TaxID=3242979 RepID=UPI003DA2F4C8
MRKKLFVLLCGLCLTLAFSVPVMAAEEEYTYTVRIFAGAQGTIGGQEVVVYKDLPYNARINFNPKSVSLNDDSKYYFKGLRESGSDNSEASSLLSFAVTGDQDYVVAYGIRGNSVAYTVNYQDEDGNTLAPSETFYGNVGDRPVVAFLYIEGYQPQAYNLTGTLSENAADNVFTFTYSAAVTGVVQTPEPPAGGEEEPTPPPIEVIEPNPVPEVNGPNGGTEDLENIDQNEVPLAQALANAKEFARRLNDLPVAGKVGILSGAILLLGGAWWLIFHKRRKRERK